MRRKIERYMLLLAIVIGLLGTPAAGQGKEAEDISGLLAGEEEKAPSKEIGEPGLVPVYGTELKEGMYELETESSSSMFRIISTCLTVKEGKMKAVITLSGKGYLKLYLGTGEQAVRAGEADYIPFEEDEEGAYTYTLPIEALNQEFECTAFSKRKEKWYDRQLLIRADTLPDNAWLRRPQQEEIQAEDGAYTMEASLEGGTGKAGIQTPLKVIVKEHRATAVVQWSSPNYDYMIVNGEKLFPVNTEGNSVFEVPIWFFDEAMEVTADTTAMSIPHEIEYKLTFYKDTLKKEAPGMAMAASLGVIAAGAGGFLIFTRMKKKRGRMAGFLLLWMLMLVPCCCVTGCHGADSTTTKGQQEKGLEQGQKDISPGLIYENSMELSYAEGFAVDYYKGGYSLLTLRDNSRFLLIPEDREPPAGLQADITLLKRPVEHIYLAATAAMDMLRHLEAVPSVRFSGQKPSGWYLAEAKEAMENGQLIYAGKYNMPDYELILSEGCGLAIENTMITHAPEVMEKLEEFGIPVLIDYASYESHPLGRTEWIKLYGALLNKEEEAEAVFSGQAEKAESLAGKEKSQKTVAFFYITANGAVNVRKTKDYIPQMIAMAGGRYIFQNLGQELDRKSSITMTMEEFYAGAKEADCLIYNSTVDGEINTLEELLEKSSLLQDFKAVREGNVWCTTSNFYQESMAAGAFMEELYQVLSQEGKSQEKMNYLYALGHRRQTIEDRR